MNTTRRYLERNAKIKQEHGEGASIASLMFKYDLRKSSIYAIIRLKQLGEI